MFDLGTNIEGKRPDLLAYILNKATGKTVAEIINGESISPVKNDRNGRGYTKVR